METLETLVAAVTLCIQDDSITDAEIIATLNRGQLEVAGGATRGYDVPTLPALPLLSDDFTVSTEVGESSVAMPGTYHRDAFYGFNENGEQIASYDSLFLFRKKFEYQPGSNVTAFCVVGNTIHYAGSPSTVKDLTIHGFRLPVDMVNDDDTPDGVPVHLQYRILFNYACMELFGIIEQDQSGGNDANYRKHSAMYGAALTDLHSAILKDQPDEYIPVDNEFSI